MSAQAAVAAQSAAAPAAVQAKKEEEKAKSSFPNRVYVGNVSFKSTSEGLKTHMAAAGKIVSAEVMAYPSGRSKGCGVVEYSSPAEAAAAIEKLTNSNLDGRAIFVREDRGSERPVNAGQGQGGGRGGGQQQGQGQGQAKAQGTQAAQPAAQQQQAQGQGNQSQGQGERGGRGRGGRGGRGARGGRGRGRGRGGRGGYEGGNSSGGYEQRQERPSNSDPANLYVGNLPFSTSEDELKKLFATYGAVAKCVIPIDRFNRSKGYATVSFAKPAEANAAIAALNETEFHERTIRVSIDKFSA